MAWRYHHIVVLQITPAPLGPRLTVRARMKHQRAGGAERPRVKNGVSATSVTLARDRTDRSIARRLLGSSGDLRTGRRAAYFALHASSRTRQLIVRET